MWSDKFLKKRSTFNLWPLWEPHYDFTTTGIHRLIFLNRSYGVDKSMPRQRSGLRYQLKQMYKEPSDKRLALRIPSVPASGMKFRLSCEVPIYLLQLFPQVIPINRAKCRLQVTFHPFCSQPSLCLEYLPTPHTPWFLYV